MRKCKCCGSEFVCWNWMHTAAIKTYIANVKISNNSWKRPFSFIKQQWLHECWDCGNSFFTMLKVKDGIPYQQLQDDFVRLPKHDLRDYIEEINYLFSMGYKMWTVESYTKRANSVGKDISALLLKVQSDYEASSDQQPSLRDIFNERHMNSDIDELEEGMLTSNEDNIKKT